jgi:uncharacterized coiled-coil protein SlyX
MKTEIRNSISGLLLIPLVVACFALLPTVQAAPDPAPPPGNNTRDGAGSMASITTGLGNTAFGSQALNKLTSGNNNNAQGNGALQNLTTGGGNAAIGSLAARSLQSGIHNTAVGNTALNAATIGSRNTALGYATLREQTAANDNVAVGWSALFHNNSASPNVAVGSQALQSNTFGGFNTATGTQALFLNVDGEDNTAVGNVALAFNTHGNGNTAVGSDALISSTGSSNIAVGSGAGGSVLAGSNNIDIGNTGADTSNTIRIGNSNHAATFIRGISGVVVSGAAVLVSGNGQLGVAASSARFKEQIKPMDKASEAILALKPVTFRYKQDIDPDGIPMFGLVAEEVEKVNPDLVGRDKEGKVFTVRYEAVNAMLLNEFLKQHREVQEQKATITQLKSTVAKQETIGAQQQKEIKALAANLKEQASQIQKVSAALEVSKPAPQMAVNNQ